MYRLDANTNFNERTKTIFETLVNIEEAHRAKTTTYITKIEEELADKEPDDLEPVSQLTDSFKSLNDKAVFKMPKPIKRCYVKKKAMYEKCPEKWTKYSLEDIKDTGNGGNYAAAMNFLNSRNKITEEDEEMLEPIEFNKPIGKNKKIIDEQEEENLNDSTEIKVENVKANFSIKKRTNRNFRKQENEIDEEENSVVNIKSLTRSKNNYVREKVVSMDEDQDEFDLIEDADANEYNQYDLFD